MTIEAWVNDKMDALSVRINDGEPHILRVCLSATIYSLPMSHLERSMLALNEEGVYSAVGLDYEIMHNPLPAWFDELTRWEEDEDEERGEAVDTALDEAGFSRVRTSRGGGIFMRSSKTMSHGGFRWVWRDKEAERKFIEFLHDCHYGEGTAYAE